NHHRESQLNDGLNQIAQAKGAHQRGKPGGFSHRRGSLTGHEPRAGIPRAPCKRPEHFRLVVADRDGQVSALSVPEREAHGHWEQGAPPTGFSAAPRQDSIEVQFVRTMDHSKTDDEPSVSRQLRKIDRSTKPANAISWLSRHTLPRQRDGHVFPATVI